MEIEAHQQRAVILETQSQLIQLDVKLKNTELVSEFMELLIKKRQLHQLLKELQNEL